MLQKKSLSDVFVMARVGKDVWKEFQEVNSLFEMGKLKDQKISGGEVVRGVVSLKQSHMKPLCSLKDEQKISLLIKVKCVIKVNLKLHSSSFTVSIQEEPEIGAQSGPKLEVLIFWGLEPGIAV